MSKFILSIAALATSVVFTLPQLHAQTAPIIHGVKARCSVSRVLGEPMRCASQLVIMNLPDAGKTIFMMKLARSNGKNLTISFIGGRDKQDTLQDYVLFVDRVRMDAEGQTRTEQAAGECHENMSDDGHHSAATRCSAVLTGGGVDELSLGSGPVD